MKVHKLKSMLLVYVIGVYMVLSGCGRENRVTGSTNDISDNVVNLENVGPACFSDRDNDSSYDESRAESIDLSDGGAAITDEGTYVMSGDLTDGKIIVNAPGKKVQLVLAGCSITSQNECPFVIEEADKVFLTLADGSVNTVADAASYTETLEDSNVDAAIFSKADLTINGDGSLEVTGSCKHGIVSKDDITITGGDIKVTSVKSGIVGKDCVQIGGGNININAGTHAISSTNEEDKDKGYVYVHSGDMSLDAGKKGIKAMSGIIVDGGRINVGSSYEGLESTVIHINGGEIDIVSSDDGINASDMYSDGEEEFGGGGRFGGGRPAGGSSDDENSSPAEKPDTDGNVPAKGRPGGDRNISAGARPDGDGNMSDGARPDGDGNMPDGARPDGDGNIPDGARPDGDGNMPDGARPNGGMRMPESDSPCDLTINGGVININASGDGIDSNGTLNMNGGILYVSGPTSHGDGAIDYNSDAVITGGTVIAAGSAGMDENFGKASSQASLLIRTGVQKKDSLVKVTDSTGKVIISWQSPKEYESVVISSPDIVSGGKYVVEAGDYKETVEAAE